MTDKRGTRSEVAILNGEMILTADMVADALHVPVSVVADLHRRGELRACKVGRHLRWPPERVRAFVKQLEGEGL